MSTCESRQIWNYKVKKQDIVIKGSQKEFRNHCKDSKAAIYFGPGISEPSHTCCSKPILLLHLYHYSILQVYTRTTEVNCTKFCLKKKKMLGNVSHNKNNPLSIYMSAVSADLKCSLYKLKCLFRVEITELRCKSLLTTHTSLYQFREYQFATWI